MVTDVSLVGLEGTFGFDPSRLQFVRFVKDESGAQLDFLSARELSDPARVRLGGVPDFGLTQALGSGSHEIGRLIFVVRGHEVPADDAAWVMGGRFVGIDLQAYHLVGGSPVTSAGTERPGGEPAGAFDFVFANPYHPGAPIGLRTKERGGDAEVAVYDV